MLQLVVERSKQAGNEAFKKNNNTEAIKMYSQAIAGAPLDHTLFGNRSAAYLALGLYEEARLDAAKAVKLKPDWPKGHYRLGCVFLAVCQWADAKAAFEAGLQVDPANKDMASRLAEARQRLEAELADGKAQMGMHRRDLVLKLRQARREEIRLSMLNQFKQSMAAPEWELDDYEWRPTFLPTMKLRPLRKAEIEANPQKRMLMNYVTALADLAHPKAALRVLHDDVRLSAFEDAIFCTLREQPGGHILVLGTGTGVLGLMAARAGAGRVTCIERSRMLFRMAKQALEGNRDMEGIGALHLLDRRLQSCGVAGETLPADVQQAVQELRAKAGEMAAAIAAQSPAGATKTASPLPERADILVTDLVDHAVLGMSLLGTLDYAAEHLLKAGARVVPSLVKVFAVLVEVRITDVSGFDLSTLNAYRWHPHHERVDLDKMPHRRLSALFAVACLDLQARVDSLSGGGAPALPHITWEADEQLEVAVTADGIWNGVAFWFEMSTYDHLQFTTWAGAASMPGTPSAPSALPLAPSWQQALQYIDGVKVQQGSVASVRVRQDMGQFHFASQPQQARPRHTFIPRWHFDMVLDTQRNSAYEQAITKALDFRRASGDGDIVVLDVGAGSGLLSMMAARAGASSVVGAEMSQHMCDVAAETVVMNGYAAQCLMVNKDVRRMDVVRKADGTPPDMDRKADIMVFEVFDSGLIGEGILHSVAAARAKLLNPDATLVPASATVHCQLIQMRIGRVKGLDMQAANRWQWRPDYEGIELTHCRERWTAVSKPVPVMSFDFYESDLNMTPHEVTLALPITADGVANAVAFWFDLQLDEETELSTSPYADKGATWQQAVQWIPELHVRKGMRAQLTAKHDTYGISFQAEQVDAQEAAKPCTPVPVKDPVWDASFTQLSALNGQLAKSCVQNPLEYRTVALAAVQFGSRPHDLGLDTEQATEFCTKMMG
ncbi:hypothetical protein WJX72_005333 [[Myrmecia] bisecta]|uniref:Protein arginine N-methyltransferase domain-containing protein n=1 Tax=[Myrmecia] bisecta TaxID=41462 RepID=A0AAW1P336_9CHLO